MPFEAKYQVSFSDINIGNHLSSSNFLSYVNNIIADYFISLGFKIDDFHGYKYIMTHIEMDFKYEIGYPNVIKSLMTIKIASKTRCLFFISFEVNEKIAFKCCVTGAFLNDIGKPQKINDSMKDTLKDDIEK